MSNFNESLDYMEHYAAVMKASFVPPLDPSIHKFIESIDKIIPEFRRLNEENGRLKIKLAAEGVNDGK